jgi:hypothetical protein
MVDTLLLRTSLHFTTLHPTTLHSTSLHFTQLHFTPLHYSCRNFTSSHLNFTQLHSNLPSPHINFLPLHVKLLALQEESCSKQLVSWTERFLLTASYQLYLMHAVSSLLHCDQSYRLPTTWHDIEPPIRCSIAVAGQLVPVSFQAHSAIFITKCLLCVRRSS